MEPAQVDLNSDPSNLEFLSGGGEMGQRIREYDWSATSIGPIDKWPQSLRTCVRIMLTSRQPIWIGWGRDLVKLYNDPYKAIVGGKHPWALGTPASVVWKDIWSEIEPMLRTVMDEDQGTYVEAQLLIMERNGYPEETYYTFSYTPIPGDDGKTAGMFCANTDDTDRIISERQLRTLTGLGKGLADCRTDEEVVQRTIRTLQENSYDFPFALIRKIQDNKGVLVQSTSFNDSTVEIPGEIDLYSDNPVAEVIRRSFSERVPQIFDNALRGPGRLPSGSWAIPPVQSVVLPILLSANTQPYGVLVVGLNPYRIFDEKYKGFFMLVADQLATSIADVRVLEEERKRALALAELDRAKTAFFSNISHEFRTPLTLLLGPIEDTIHDSETSASSRLRLEMARRNALRMQKLVNSLLDFSRIEAGRVEGKFSKVNLTTYTRDLASSFEGVIEKAGLELRLDIKPIDDEVFVDVDMWEKIVLNLISNAVKYSRQGSIGISLRQKGDKVMFTVSDTGIGIAREHQQKIFERFHRIDNMEGRSQEGTGIGLAMVKELVKIHQGTIGVESTYGKGSVFTVTILTGRKHLPAERLDDTAQAVQHNSLNTFVQEAQGWMNNKESLESIDNNLPAGKSATLTVLLADDNTDMRDYVFRLLSSRYRVVHARDGEEALELAHRHRPDLIVSDIMMPKLNGFALLRALRAHSDIRHTPVILLSARAGEEAKVEGLEAGADDYLVKPFSAKELLARVEATIKISKSRLAAEKNLKVVIQQAPVAMALLTGPDLVVDIANQSALEIWGRKHEEVIAKPIFEALPEIVEQGFGKILLDVYNTGKGFRGDEVPIELVRFGERQKVYINFTYEALRNDQGHITSILGVGVDVTVQVLARNAAEASGAELKTMANAMPQLVWVSKPEGEVLYFNDRISEFEGMTRLDGGNWSWEGLIHPDDLEETNRKWALAVSNGEVFQCEHRLKKKKGGYRWHLSRAIPQNSEQGSFVKWFGTTTDIHAAREQSDILENEVRKRTEELSKLNLALQRSNEDLLQFAHVASHDLKEPVRKIKTFARRLEQEFPKQIPEKGRIYISKVQLAAQRMNVMIEGVLNYSTLNASEARAELVNLDEVITNIESDLEVVIREKNAMVQRPRALPAVEGASILLYQLFYNLFNNSLKFSRTDVPCEIVITGAVRSEGYAEITVTDNGIGFDNSFSDKIFETFSRLNSKDMYEGTGIGLALCKKIAERHHGHIKATGKEDVGATFVITLPLVQPAKKI